jgi:type II secretory pathway pseudopilin PulG
MVATAARRPRHARDRERGLSTTEALVAIAVIALLTISLQEALHGSLQFARSATAQTERADAWRSTMRLMRSVIEAASPDPEGGRPGRYTVVFHGEAIGFATLTTIPAYALGGGRQRVWVGLGGPNADALIMRWRPELDSGRGAAAAATLPAVELLDGVRMIRFSYLGRRDGQPEAQWSDSWSGQATLPKLVRLDIMFEDGGRVRRLSLTAAPRASADSLCAIDPLTRRCRGT